MSVFDWLRDLAGASRASPSPTRSPTASSFAASLPLGSAASRPRTSVSDSTPSLTDAEKAALEVGGLNFMDAIRAHQKWKKRLTTYLDGTSDEKLDYRAICRDDQCVLGKWINGAGSDAYGHIPIFSQLKMTHAQFHLAAGTIVRLHDEGKTDQAKEALRHGDYPQHSIKVQGLISSLYMDIKGVK